MLLLDDFIALPPVEENKIETQVRCMSTKFPINIEWEGDTNNTAQKSWYTYSSLPVVEVIVLTRILDHLMWQIAISDGWMNWQKYPKNEKSIRILQPQTLDCNICPTCFKINCWTGPHDEQRKPSFLCFSFILHSSLILS